ncbi:NAD(P)-dependent oxidoreductase [Sphingobacterium chuzhouense]|uniref:Dihydrofolate reductase n=1 Tax=Sphingobacterium chuzhouense TaxID=1742264 RepID=A0ABR7XRQ2_9SPHI|nr:NAD(P)-dependent oxidoreductase [Sphingobacterium chuzhouense]MBD1421567.1 dihydrofolate reductase [Sphingobacterium chuzhouense]
MFKKIVAVEPLNLIPSAEKALFDYAEKVVFYPNSPQSAEEMALRIGDADAVLISYISPLGKDALKKCPNVKYIGMCCSLYSPESANVDIRYANSRGIAVLGVRDYGDEGVVEYVVSELVRCLHGFGKHDDGTQRAPWDGVPREITDTKVGILGLGKSGGMVADALAFFGAEISYFARSEKEDAKRKGYRFLPLRQLLKENEVIVACLNRGVVLMHEEEFAEMGDRKILFNTGLSPAWDEEPFARWIDRDNRCYCDTLIALGNEKFLTHTNVHCMQVSVGRTRQAFIRLSEKVLANIENYLKTQ